MTRPLLSFLTLAALMALAVWAYRENYATQAGLRRLAALEREVAGLHEALAVQRAEWAYLNRPDRLRDLVAMNFDRVPLLPFDPAQFAGLDEVPAPLVRLLPPDLAPVDLSGTLTDAEDPL
jgi:hypothetical protein